MLTVLSLRQARLCSLELKLGDFRGICSQSCSAICCYVVYLPVPFVASAIIVHRAVCLFTSQLTPVLIAPTHGEMARLS